MNILLTGATGYLGSRLLTAWLDEGHRVSVLKRQSSDLARVGHLAGRFEAHDVEDGLPALFAEHGAYDAIVHSATCYGRDSESAEEVFQFNTVYSLGILNAAVNAKTPLFLNVGTALNPMMSPYALSKRQFAEWGRLYAEHGRITFIEAALEHFFGPDDDDSKFVTMLVRNCLRNVGEIDLSLGEQVRDFFHVDDAAAALMTLLSRGQSLGPGYHRYEVGSGKAVPIRQFAEMICDITGSSTRLCFGAVPYRINEVMRSVADIKPLRSLGWEPRFTLEGGLRDKIEQERAIMQRNIIPCAS